MAKKVKKKTVKAKQKRVRKKPVKKAAKKTKPIRKRKVSASKVKLKVKRKTKAKIKSPAKTAEPTSPTPSANETFIGKITHYFPHVCAGIAEITTGDLKMGDVIHIKGITTDLTQEVKSIQINRQPITQAKVGDIIGIEVTSRVREHDSIYKLVS